MQFKTLVKFANDADGTTVQRNVRRVWIDTEVNLAGMAIMRANTVPHETLEQRIGEYFSYLDLCHKS